MAVNKRFTLDQDDDEFEVLRQKYDKLEAEHQRLQKQNKTQQEKQRPPRTPSLPPKRSSIFLILAAMVTTARLAIYILVEQWGTRDQIFGYGISVVFSLAGILMVVAWVIDDAKVEGWITAGSVLFLAVQIIIAISILDPNLLETGVPGPAQHPVPAALVLISALLSAATRMVRLIIGGLLLLVSNPFRR